MAKKSFIVPWQDAYDYMYNDYMKVMSIDKSGDNDEWNFHIIIIYSSVFSIISASVIYKLFDKTDRQ